MKTTPQSVRCRVSRTGCDSLGNQQTGEAQLCHYDQGGYFGERAADARLAAVPRSALECDASSHRFWA